MDFLSQNDWVNLARLIQMGIDSITNIEYNTGGLNGKDILMCYKNSIINSVINSVIKI